MNISKIKEKMHYDGCYALKSNHIGDYFTTEELHERYKDLAKVEKAFRIEKTVHLNVRLIYLRKETKTRAHLLIVMLAYKIYNSIQELWSEIDISIKEGILILNQIQTIKIKNKLVLLEPNDKCKKLIKILNISQPRMKN